MEIRRAARAIISEGDTVFCARLRNYTNKPNFENYWCLPGGSIEGDETPEQALRREIEEEFGVAAQMGRLLFTQKFMKRGVPKIELFYHVKNSDAFHDIDLSSTQKGEEEIAEYGFQRLSGIDFRPRVLRGMDMSDFILSGRGSVDITHDPRLLPVAS